MPNIYEPPQDRQEVKVSVSFLVVIDITEADFAMKSIMYLFRSEYDGKVKIFNDLSDHDHGLKSCNHYISVFKVHFRL